LDAFWRSLRTKALLGLWCGHMRQSPRDLGSIFADHDSADRVDWLNEH